MNIKADINNVMEDVKVDVQMKDKIMQSAMDKQTKKGKRVMKKKILVVALAAVLCIGTIAISADEIEKIWDKTIASIFRADNELQEELVDEGYVEVVEEESNYEGLYYITMNTDVSMIGSQMEVNLAEFQTPERLYEGKWDFVVDLGGCEKSVRAELNNTYEYDNDLRIIPYHLKSIEIFPFTVCIKYESIPDGPGKTLGNIPIRIVMKDGTEYADLNPEREWSEDPFIMSSFSGDKRKKIRSTGVAIDIDEIDYVEVAGVEYDIN